MEFFNNLKKLREDRNMTESAQNHYKADMFDGLSHYYRATNDYDRLNASCRMAIVTINHAELNTIDLEFKESPSYQFEAIGTIVSEIVDKKDHYYKKFLQQSLTQVLISIKKRYVDSLPYEFENCMLETIKEISSIRQDPKQFAQWVENGPSGKWLKDKNQNPQTLYRANYKNCKLY